jgi:hypothetical protein
MVVQSLAMRPSTLFLVRLVTALAALVWIGAGALVGLNYGLADAGTARAQAPALAVYASYLLPLAGGALFCRAALLAGQPDRIPVRRSVAAGAVCALAWVVVLIVLRATT